MKPLDISHDNKFGQSLEKPSNKTMETIDRIIRSKPKPDETQKDFLKRTGVIRY